MERNSENRRLSTSCDGNDSHVSKEASLGETELDAVTADGAPPAIMSEEARHVEHVSDETKVNSREDITHDATYTQDDMGPGDDSGGTIYAPTDTGWAWVILLAATMEYFLVVGYMKCIGIFFVQWQQRFHSNASATSMVVMLMSTTFSIGALVVMTLGMKYMSCRTSVMVGAVVAGISYIITAFAGDIKIVYVSYGFLNGVSVALTQPTTVTMINVYFVKYRGMANNIANAGVSLGGLALAPLLTKLFDHYAYTGTFMIAAALLFNVAVCGALLRPIETYSKHGPKMINRDKRCDEETSHDAATERLLNDVKNMDEEKNADHAANSTLNGSVSKLASLPYERPVSKSGSFMDMLSRSLVDITHSSQSVVRSEKGNSCEMSTPAKTESLSFTQYMRNICIHIFNGISTTMGLDLFSNPVFLFYLTAAGILCAGNVLAADFMAPRAKDMGIDDDSIALLLSVECGADLISKFIFGYITDKHWMRTSTLMALASAALGIATHLMYFMTTFQTIMVYAVVVGLLEGVYFSLYAVVIVDYMSLGNLKRVLGFNALVQGISMGAAYPVAGIIRDGTGSYVASYHFIGSLLLLGAAMCVCLPAVQQWNNRRHTTKHHV